jgi:hypothetical protein
MITPGRERDVRFRMNAGGERVIHWIAQEQIRIIRTVCQQSGRPMQKSTQGRALPGARSKQGRTRQRLQ